MTGETIENKEYIYRIPAKNGVPSVKLPKFTEKKKGNIVSHLKRYTIRFNGSVVEIVTDKEYNELKDYIVK